MSPQNHGESQRSADDPIGVEKKLPGEENKTQQTTPERQNADERLRQSDLEKERSAHSGDESKGPRRYDESDPNWVEPDVQMENQTNPAMDY
jgi:hypothetical protein